MEVFTSNLVLTTRSGSCKLQLRVFKVVIRPQVNKTTVLNKRNQTCIIVAVSRVDIFTYL